MRGRPGRYNVQPPMSLTRPDVMRGPRFTSTGPVQEPPPPRLIGFPVGPAVLWRGQSLCDGCRGAFKFRPLDKDDAAPRVRKADGGECEGGPVGTTYRMS